MKTKIQYRWPMLCAVVLFFACQKEVSNNSQSEKNILQTTSGVIPDDPERLANIVLVKSSDFTAETSVSNDGRVDGGSTKRGAKRDSDSDGIPDTKDACPTEKEVVNGYLDEDGCPDEVPPAPTPTPAPSDSDGDGILDSDDSCPSEPETVNGFQDEDGCPDTPVIILPPATIPSSFELMTPPVGSQGNEGACAPFAVTYAARSIEYFYTSNATAYSFSTNVFSPEYVYNQVKFDGCGSGTSLTACLDLMTQQGVCTFQSMPYDDLNGCSLMPDATQISSASGYKINSYVRMMNTDEMAIKTMIASKHAVIATVIADNSFINARTGFVWSAYSGSGTLPHALVICGYDDAKGAFKVMNSWGTLWGDAGYSWITYDFFPQKSGYYVFAIQ